jgi:Zn-dependent M28 family amino/carboxypeptidase
MPAEERGPAMAALEAAEAEQRRLRPAAVIFLTARPRRGGRGTSLKPAGPERAAFPSLVVSKAFADVPGEPTVSLHLNASAVKAAKLRNVIGILRGTDAALRDSFVVVSAHYDHLGMAGENGIYHGANDDASGTASLLEIATALRDARPRRSIVFAAFFGEEKGLLGSRYCVQHPVFPLEKTVANVNLEQLGRTDDSRGAHVARANLTGFDYSDIGALFARTGQPLGVEFSKQDGDSDTYFAASDNLPFAQAGIPAHTVSVAYMFPDYHQPGDQWPKLDFDNMAKVDQAVAAAVLAIANSSEAPAWNQSNPKAAAFARKRR